MISQDKRNLKLIYSILLFLILSLFTVYPHIDILKYRSETVIDNNAKDRKYISSYQLNKNDYISTTININDKIKELVFQIDTSKIKNNIKIELSQENINQIYVIGQSNDINKIIKLEKNKFKAGKLNIKINNTSENTISYIVNYPNKTSGYIKLNGEKDVNAFSIYLKTIYSGSDFLLVSWIVFILILLIQGYISYIVFAKELQDNRVYWLSALLFLLVCILRFPLLTLWAEPTAETFVFHVKHNLDKSFSLIDILFTREFTMTYLSSIINIIGRILGLDKYLVVYLYMTGIIIACLWLALFTRISLRKYFPDYIRLIITFSLLALWKFEAFYVTTMFTYWGIYFIIFMYLIDLEKLSKFQYILGMILIFLIVNNKMSYIFLVPSAFLMIFYYGLKNKRNLYMQIVIIISCFMNYIVYSILTPSESNRHSGMMDRIFDIKTGILKMLDGIASVINLQLLFPKYTQIFSLFILCVIAAFFFLSKRLKNTNEESEILFSEKENIYLDFEHLTLDQEIAYISISKNDISGYNRWLPFYFTFSSEDDLTEKQVEKVLNDNIKKATLNTENGEVYSTQQLIWSAYKLENNQYNLTLVLIPELNTLVSDEPINIKYINLYDSKDSYTYSLASYLVESKETIAEDEMYVSLSSMESDILEDYSVNVNYGIIGNGNKVSDFSLEYSNDFTPVLSYVLANTNQTEDNETEYSVKIQLNGNYKKSVFRPFLKVTYNDGKSGYLIPSLPVYFK